MTLPVYDPDTHLVMLFDDDHASGPYFMRGAVCLPCLTEQTAGPECNLEGVVLIAGVDGKDMLKIFEEHRFFTAGTTVLDGKVVDRGAAAAYTSGWSNYYCRDYYVHQPVDSIDQHNADLRRMPTQLAMRPRLIEVDWTDVATAETALLSRIHRGALVFNEKGMVHDALQLYSANRKQPSPAAWAAMTLCAGTARMPLRRS